MQKCGSGDITCARNQIQDSRNKAMDKSKLEKKWNYRFRIRVKSGNALITIDLVAQIALVKQTIQ